MLKFDNCNILMQEILSKKFKQEVDNLCLDNEYFLDVFNSRILVKQDFLLFEKTANPEVNSSSYNNNTHFEISQNRLHMSDLFTESKNTPILFKIGLVFVEFLYYKLKVLFPNRKIGILISYDVENEFGCNDCFVSFYQIRQNEIYLPENLNEFKKDAVGVIYVNNTGINNS